MKDKFGRTINNLRLSVTGRCNLACIYCDREGKETSAMIDVDSAGVVLHAARELGIDTVKLTGGEPLLHPKLEEIVKIARNLHYRDIGLTTNGTLLFPKRAKALRDAGLMRVNINLPTLDERTYKRITGRDFFNTLISNIQHATSVFDRVKLNMVVLKGINHHEIANMISFAGKIGATLQLIELHPLGLAEKIMDLKYDLGGVENAISFVASAKKVRQMQGRPVYRINNTTIEFVRFRPPFFCSKCTKIRVMADGTVLPCLFMDIGLTLRDYMLSGDIDGAKRILQEAINRKILW